MVCTVQLFLRDNYHETYGWLMRAVLDSFIYWLLFVSCRKTINKPLIHSVIVGVSFYKVFV